jgi:hypothetical protein
MEKAMRVRDLRATLESIRSIFKAAGAPAQEKVLGKISSELEAHDDAPLQSYLEEIERRATVAATPLTEQFIRRLRSAELDEDRFKAVVADIQQRRLKKTDVQKIAAAYTGSYDRRASVEKLIDAIKSAFYAKVYERDSQAIAGRAKPI